MAKHWVPGSSFSVSPLLSIIMVIHFNTSTYSLSVNLTPSPPSDAGATSTYSFQTMDLLEQSTWFKWIKVNKVKRYHGVKGVNRCDTAYSYIILTYLDLKSMEFLKSAQFHYLIVNVLFILNVSRMLPFHSPIEIHTLLQQRRQLLTCIYLFIWLFTTHVIT